MLTLGQAGGGASRRYSGVHNLHVTLSGDDLLSHQHFVTHGAVLTLGQAGGGASRRHVGIHNFGMPQSVGVIVHVAVTANRTSIGGIAAVDTVRSGHHRLIGVGDLSFQAALVTIGIAGVIVYVVRHFAQHTAKVAIRVAGVVVLVGVAPVIIPLSVQEGVVSPSHRHGLFLLWQTLAMHTGQALRTVERIIPHRNDGSGDDNGVHLDAIVKRIVADGGDGAALHLIGKLYRGHIAVRHIADYGLVVVQFIDDTVLLHDGTHPHLTGEFTTLIISAGSQNRKLTYLQNANLTGG